MSVEVEYLVGEQGSRLNIQDRSCKGVFGSFRTSSSICRSFSRFLIYLFAISRSKTKLSMGQWVLRLYRGFTEPSA